MHYFKIAEIARISGVRQATIRIWEYRYAVFSPGRTPGNQRSYTLADLERLLLIALLNKNGHRISALTPRSLPELLQLVQSSTDTELKAEQLANELIVAMYGNQPDAFNAILARGLAQLGHRALVDTVILPFVVKTDLFHYPNGEAHIHFAVTAIRSKLIVALDAAGHAAPGTPSAVLFLPKGEHFDLLLLYAALKLRQEGWRVLYLGTNVPVESLIGVLEREKPQRAYTYEHGYQKVPADYFVRVARALEPMELFVLQAHAQQKPEQRGVRRIRFPQPGSAVLPV